MILNTLNGFMVGPKDEPLHETFSLPVLAYEADTWIKGMHIKGHKIFMDY